MDAAARGRGQRIPYAPRPMSPLRADTRTAADTWRAVADGVVRCCALRLLVFDPEGDFPEQSYAGNVAAVVRSAPRSHRVVVNTGSLCHVPHAIAGLDWEALDAALIGSSSVLQIGANAPQEWAADVEARTRLALESMLPRLAGAGRLRFVATLKHWYT